MSICQMYIDNTILMYLFCIFGVFFYSPLVGKDKLECPLKQKWYVPSFADITFVVLEKKCWKFAKFINGQTNGPKISIINLLLCWVVLFWTESCNAAYEFLLLLYLIIFCCIYCCNFAVFKLLVASCGSVYK